MNWPTGKQLLVLIPCALALGHFFVSVGRTETFTDLIIQQWYYVDLAFVSAISFVILFYCVTTHNTLDSRLPLREVPAKRLVWQVGIGVLIPVFLSFLLTFAYMYFMLNQDIRTGSFFVYEFPISIVIIFMINLVLIVLSLWLVPQPAKSAVFPTTILASQGNRTVPLPIRSIAMFSKEGDHYLITTFDLQQYVSPHHLEELEVMVAPCDFFRANRQILIHREACGYFTTDRSGKLTLHLSTKPEPISISQKRASEFRTWLAQ